VTLNKRITFQRKEKTGTGSLACEIWVDAFSTWVSWVNVHGSEAWTAASVQAQKAATVTMRYNPLVNERLRIVYKGIVYEIVSVDNIKEQNRVLELKVRACANG